MSRKWRNIWPAISGHGFNKHSRKSFAKASDALGQFVKVIWRVAYYEVAVPKRAKLGGCSSRRGLLKDRPLSVIHDINCSIHYEDAAMSEVRALALKVVQPGVKAV